MSIWKWKRSSSATTVIAFLFVALLGYTAYIFTTWVDIRNQNNTAKKYAAYIKKHTRIVENTIPMSGYFAYLDFLLVDLDTSFSYSISEHELVQHNPWIIDRLENTDYYRLMEQGIFQYDPGVLPILFPNDTIRIPDSIQIVDLSNKLNQISININIPEFSLRINYGDSTLYKFPVRVGQNKSKHLAMVGQEVDLRTRTGSGSIVRINKKPRFTNPVDNHHYEVTKRDDNRVTKLPFVPWIEPELNGIRHGQLIHPTTNPVSLGKAYSNGCIGMAEADMWRTYYYAPIGTKVEVLYKLNVPGPTQDSTIQLRDIYPEYRDQSGLPKNMNINEDTCICDK